MVRTYLMDSNVFIANRFPEDKYHHLSEVFFESLSSHPILTQSAALEVARIVRQKMNELTTRIFTETDVRNQDTDLFVRKAQFDELMTKLRRSGKFGVFLDAVNSFCQGEFHQGEGTLHRLTEWTSEQVIRVVEDITSFCGVYDIQNLPGEQDEEDGNFITECQGIIGKNPVTHAEDAKIFWDAIAFCRTRMETIVLTLDGDFASSATVAIDALVKAGKLTASQITFTDIKTESH